MKYYYPVAIIITIIGLWIILYHAATPPSVLYFQGKVLDLPEELTAAKPTDSLGVEITKDTIFIYFK